MRSSLSHFSVILPTIIYASRTHSQLSQVIDELKRSPYSYLSSIMNCLDSQTSYLRAGQQETNVSPSHSEESERFSPHSLTPIVFKILISGTMQNLQCRTHVLAHGCGYHDDVKVRFFLSYSILGDWPRKGLCGKKKKNGQCRLSWRQSHWYRRISERRRARTGIVCHLSLVFWLWQVCPYYLAREMQQSAEMVFLPYNYLLDPSIRGSLNLDLSKYVSPFVYPSIHC